MVREDRGAWKSNYFDKLKRLFEEYDKLFVVGADNVRSKQFQEIRIALRGKGVILMGKNTMMRKAIKDHVVQDNQAAEKILNLCVGNVGFVFVKDDFDSVRQIINEKRLRAPARAGAISPVDVVVPSQNTGMGPEKTSFFQALNIATKISRGTIEILNDVKVLEAGKKVGPSEATLLNMLNVSPFTYGLELKSVYDEGNVYAPAVLDIKEEDLVDEFMKGIASMASISLALGYPTQASIPHTMINAAKQLVGVTLALDSDYSFPIADKVKEILADPSKFAAAAPVASAAAADAPKEEAKKEESEEESDDDMGFGLFD